MTFLFPKVFEEIELDDGVSATKVGAGDSGVWGGGK